MPAAKFATVDLYLESLDEIKRKTLSDLLDLIASEFPELEVKLAWNTPMVHLKGEYVVGLSASKKHLSFSPWSPAVLEAFAPRLAGYVTKKNLFQIPVDWEIDAALVRDLVAARLAEIQEDK